MLAGEAITVSIAGSVPCYPLPGSKKQQSHQLYPAPAGGVPYLLYLPDTLSVSQAPLVLIHGISRNCYEHIDAFADYAQQTGRMLIAPLFDEKNCQRYQQVWTKKCRADQLLLAVLQDVSRLTGYTFQKVALYGFSGGAQFGHRFAMLHPEKVDRLAIASAGWYTFPDHQQRFPYGISAETTKGVKLTQNLPKFLSIPVLVLAGELDIKRDANLRKGRTIDGQQGRTRVERAARWVRAMQYEADVRGIQTDITLRMMAVSTHDFKRCIQQGQMVTCVTQWLSV